MRDELEDKMRNLLAKASVVAEAPSANIDAEKTSSGKAGSVILHRDGRSLYDRMRTRFAGAHGDHAAEKAIEWAEAALDEARRGAELAAPLFGSMAWKRKVAADVRAADTRKEVGVIARLAEISAATAYRWAKMYPADYGDRDDEAEAA